MMNCIRETPNSRVSKALMNAFNCARGSRAASGRPGGGKWSPSLLKKAHGRLRPRQPCTFVCRDGMEPIVLQGEVAGRAFHEAHGCCDVPRNPGVYLVVVALICGSDAQSFMENGKCTTLPYFSSDHMNLGA